MVDPVSQRLQRPATHCSRPDRRHQMIGQPLRDHPVRNAQHVCGRHSLPCQRRVAEHGQLQRNPRANRLQQCPPARLANLAQAASPEHLADHHCQLFGFFLVAGPQLRGRPDNRRLSCSSQRPLQFITGNQLDQAPAAGISQQPDQPRHQVINKHRHSHILVAPASLRDRCTRTAVDGYAS